MGRKGIVSSAHQLATAAGLQMLRDGGNAVDAAVAVAAALSVVEPGCSGPGGCGIMIISQPGSSAPTILDFIGPAPKNATFEAFAAPGSKDDGVRSTIVPGAIAGWLSALARFGRLPAPIVFRPAIEYAKKGFPVSPYFRRYIQGCERRLGAWPTSATVYLPGGGAPDAGDMFVQSELGASLELIAYEGAEVFYDGPLGEAVVAFSQAQGGLLTMEDLRTYKPAWRDPISTTFRDYTIFAPPPPSSSVQYLLAMNMLEKVDLGGMDPGSADYVHLVAETFKLAIADRIHWTVSHPGRWKGLLDKDYAAKRSAEVDMSRAREVEGEHFQGERRESWLAPGQPPQLDRELTTHFVTMDEAGWSVACTQTLGTGFGGAAVHGDTGILLNSLMHWFDDHPDSPNVIAPGKSLEMSLAPSQIWRDGKPFALIGTPGSWGILQTTPQLLFNLLHHELNIQSAIEAPRFRVLDGLRLAIEDRFSSVVLEDLAARGHHIEKLAPWDRFVGGAHGAMIDPAKGTFFGGADPRRDGCAMGYMGYGGQL